MTLAAGVRRGGDPLWYKDAIVYEIHVRAFSDSNGDGVGDFRGLAERLDYLVDLGVTTLWLLPFYPSPLRDDGYDISDYTRVHPAYGTLHDFKYFLREAQRRGLRVISELVLNHTSDQHPWFQRARRDRRWRDYYVWSDTPDRYRGTRIIFKDFEPSNWTWDPVAKAYYWHRFYSHQPDLNFDNPMVRESMLEAVDFWLGLGVDGLRLDAVPYLYERDGTNCENLPETHVLLKQLRSHIDAGFESRLLLAEANQWPEDAVAYFGSGDECHMAFHFPIMPRMFMAIHMEDRFPITDILEQTPAIPESCQWALFLRNHDELTLEMVTDAERDYMYRVYAHDPQARVNLGIRRRLAPLLWNNRRKIELMNGLLFSLPGTPVLYYGDEIGMGDNIYLGDRNGVRTPMQWSSDRNAGFSRANPQRLYLPVFIDPEYHYETVNVEAQQSNQQSLLWWIKRLIALRKRFRAFGRGTIEFLFPRNAKCLAFIRRYEEERILVVANLSRFVQFAELDLSAWRGMVPVELFGTTRFPTIGELPYLLTLGPHAFYWFALEPAHPAAIAVEQRESPAIDVSRDWEAVLRGSARSALELALPAFLQTRPWFRGKTRRVRGAHVVDSISLGNGANQALVAIVQVDHPDGESETYLLPLTFVPAEQAARLREIPPQAELARLRVGDRERQSEGKLIDGVFDRVFWSALLDSIGRRRRLKGAFGELIAQPTRAYRALRGPAEQPLEPTISDAEEDSPSAVYGGRLILKLYRRPGEGVSPELEVGRFLTERTSFLRVPPTGGSIEYRPDRREPITLGVLKGFVPGQGDAWRYTLDELGRYFERALSRHRDAEAPVVPQGSLLDLTQMEPPDLVRELMSSYLESARLLGRRTAELHLALASVDDDPAFAPEPMSSLYQRSLYQSMRNLTGQVFKLLRERLPDLPEPLRAEAQQVLGLRPRVLSVFHALVGRQLTGLRTRHHGNYSLETVLYTGNDFVIIDFEGEPGRPISERRAKHCPLRDVAAMLRSFQYAAFKGLLRLDPQTEIRAVDRAIHERWATLWQTWASSAFLKSYLEGAGPVPFLPREGDEMRAMLDIGLMEKAVFEVGYELAARPDWVGIPLYGIRQILHADLAHA
ncbi:MAG TPA: maltose alpha-D-glucosyltransferase [Candidatus Bathyarchaeia archaeon]|nr:maltose alpha-D-glucosyltransferase [Candidatus Bathyarchaeia archaeon]